MLCAANIAHLTFYVVDEQKFVPRPFYAYAVAMVIAAVKIMFFANPMPGAASKKKS